MAHYSISIRVRKNQTVYCASVWNNESDVVKIHSMANHDSYSIIHILTLSALSVEALTSDFKRWRDVPMSFILNLCVSYVDKYADPIPLFY